MSTVDEIQRDLACPRCDYNLRGLRGAIVTCPECGQECDVAKMVARRWNQPWFQAPGLSRVYLPAAWAVIGAVTSPFLFNDADWSTRLLMIVGYAGGWALMLSISWRVFESIEGVQLALLAHVLLAGYFAALGGIFGGIVMAFGQFSDRRVSGWELFGAIGVILLIPAGVVLAWLCQRGERFIGERCIRQYLNRRPRG